MRCLKLTIAYDGTNYCGWQIQPNQPTVQESVEAAIAEITGEQVRIFSSSRTDSGVHALGQVVSFSTKCTLPHNVLRRAINAHLPEDILVLAVEGAPPGFHATQDATSKRYRYLLHDGPLRNVFQRHYLWQWPVKLDTDAMHRSAQALCGRHDFASFQTLGSPRDSTIRTIFEISVKRGFENDPHKIALEVEGDGFLYNMVRAIVGTLYRVGQGDRPESWPAEVLAGKDRRLAGQTAPAQGLFLVQVNYANTEFLAE